MLDPAVTRLFTLPFRFLTPAELDVLTALTGEEIEAYAEAALRLPDLVRIIRESNPSWN